MTPEQEIVANALQEAISKDYRAAQLRAELMAYEYAPKYGEGRYLFRQPTPSEAARILHNSLLREGLYDHATLGQPLS